MSIVSNVTIFVEHINRNIQLQLTPAQIERASDDNDYLQRIVDEYLENENSPPLSQPSPPLSQPSPPLPPSCNSEEPQESQLVNEDDGNVKTFFIWSQDCVLLLLSIYEEKEDSFNNGVNRHKKIWEEIALKMQLYNENYKVTGGQCQSKLNSLKKKYKKILDHNGVSGNDRASWIFFDRMHEIFGSTGWAQPRSLASEEGPTHDPPLPPATTATKRRKEARIEEMEDRKKARAEREKWKKDQFEKLLEVKERHHQEKLNILKLICEKMTK